MRNRRAAVGLVRVSSRECRERAGNGRKATCDALRKFFSCYFLTVATVNKLHLFFIGYFYRLFLTHLNPNATAFHQQPKRRKPPQRVHARGAGWRAQAGRQAGRRRTPQPAIGSTQQKQFAPSLSLALVRCGAPFRTPISLDAVVGALEAHKTPSLLQRHGHFPSGHN